MDSTTSITYTEEIRPDGRALIVAADGVDEWDFGLLCRDEGRLYIGCVGCEQEITATEAGMCSGCRADLGWRAQMASAS